MNKIIIFCLMVLFLGCANAKFTQLKSVSYQPTNEVEVLYETPTKPHITFGLIDGGGSIGTDIDKVLKKGLKGTAPFNSSPALVFLIKSKK